MASAIKWSDLDFMETLGEGQAGIVWLAKLKSTIRGLDKGSLVAVKTYKAWVLEQAGQFERIIRELEIGRRIVHPNLLKSLSVILDPEGKPSLVMTYYVGETLERYLERTRAEKKPADVEYSFKIVADLASAIDTLHDAGAIHRDVKPANIILGSNGPILMDLGVVKSNDFPEQTTFGAFLGTIRYAAPEYLLGDVYDEKIDIYSLGAIVYELFMGQLFLEREKHWARLIVEKSSRHAYIASFRNEQMLRQKYGDKIGSFLAIILSQTLSNDPSKRKLPLDNLAAAITNRLWEKSYHFDGQRFSGGIPKLRFNLLKRFEDATD